MKYGCFWSLWSVAALLATVVLGFFVVGIADRSVSSFNIAHWLVLLLVIAGVLGGSLWLSRAGYPLIAVLPLLIVLLPGLFFAVYALLFVFGHGRVN